MRKTNAFSTCFYTVFLLHDFRLKNWEISSVSTEKIGKIKMVCVLKKNGKWVFCFKQKCVKKKEKGMIFIHTKEKKINIQDESQNHEEGTYHVI